MRLAHEDKQARVLFLAAVVASDPILVGLQAMACSVHLQLGKHLRAIIKTFARSPCTASIKIIALVLTGQADRYEQLRTKASAAVYKLVTRMTRMMTVASSQQMMMCSLSAASQLPSATCH